MKILIHTDEYFPTSQACAYRMGVMAEVLEDMGHEVTVICSSANLDHGEKKVRKERIIYSPTISMKKKTTLMRLLNNVSFAISSIFSAAISGKCDLVITTSPPPLISISGWIIAKMKRARLVYDVRDIWPDVALEMGSFTKDSIYYKVFRLITSFMYQHSDRITTVSKGKVSKIKKYVYAITREKLATKKVKFVSNGFDESVLTYEYDPDFAEQYQLDRKFTCVYVGNIGLAQGLSSFLQLAEETKHKEIQFLIFGQGAEKEKIEREAEERGLKQVKFCGILPHEKIYTLLSKAQISFISLKSSNMKDSIPTKVYEALGIGCPVFLLAEGDSCDIVKETGLGCCLSPDDLSELAGTFDRMVDQYEQIIGRKAQAMELMKEKYSRQQIARSFEKNIRKWMKESV